MSRHRNTFTKRGRSSTGTKMLFGLIGVCAIVIMLSIEGVVSYSIGGVACLVMVIIAIGVGVMSTTNR